MLYAFINTYITVEGISPQPLDEFSAFRTPIPGSRELFHVTARIVDELPEVSGTGVYRDYTGVNVFVNKKAEYREFRDILTGTPYALLIESEEDRARHMKTLYFRRKYTEAVPVNERKLLNCIAPEKTLSENHCYILHASFVKTEAGALLFTAPSGTGKSTQADLWCKCKHAELINGDRAAIWRENGKWLAGGIPWCGTSGVMKNETVPLKAIIMLDQAPANAVSSLSLMAKIKRLLEQITINPWNREMLRRTQIDMLQLCEDIPVLHLACLPDRGAVDALSAALEN